MPPDSPMANTARDNTTLADEWTLHSVHAAWGDMVYGYLVSVVASPQLADELYSEVLEKIVAKQMNIRAAANPEG